MHLFRHPRTCLRQPRKFLAQYRPLASLVGRGAERPTTTAEIPPTAVESVVALPAVEPPAAAVEPMVIELARGPAAATDRARGRLRIVFLSGEPHTPGHSYRVERYAAAARDLGHEVGLEPAARAENAVHNCPHADLVVIWRAEWAAALEAACAVWRRNGARIVFDVDDHMFDPDLARVEVIDGIRSLGVAEEQVAEMYGRVQRTLLAADVGTATTEELACGMRSLGRTAFVLPNGFDWRTYRASRLAAIARGRQEDDGLVRIGYAAGSCTHQQDFAAAVSAVAGVLRDNPHCRLVLFRQGAFGRKILDPAEFPDLTGLEHQVEWRPMVPLAQLPEEMARFDVNIAPLEVDNVFCEAKSELKFFEAALVGVPTVASPTGPFARAIRDGETGMLARTAAEWRAALGELVADPALRRRLGRAAAIDVLWTFGPDGRVEALDGFLTRLFGDDRRRAGSFLPALARPARRRPLPEIPDAEVLFERQGGDVAEVAVLIPCYNYGRYVDEALDSVRDQTAASIELVVVDDGSTDDSVAVVQRWLAKHAGRFVAATHLRNRVNSGLSATRNCGFARATAPLVLPLDADNLLTPGCVAALRDALVESGAAAAHPTLDRFGDVSETWPALPWCPDRLRGGNYIDAMALIRRSTWARCGGYVRVPYGWEDYDFWCSMAEEGLWSRSVPEAVARYRVHGSSMLHTATDIPANRPRLVDFLHARHPWLTIPPPRLPARRPAASRAVAAASPAREAA
jgi:GT2 family glycosyltransferase/glycosyltransferase involved in cell wall biosynthesis